MFLCIGYRIKKTKEKEYHDTAQVWTGNVKDNNYYTKAMVIGFVGKLRITKSMSLSTRG